MGKKSSEERFGARGIWEQLEAMVREQIERFVQRLLEEEVTELVGRAKSHRRPVVGDAAPRPVYPLRDGRKMVLAIEPGHRESAASWAGLLRDLRERGLTVPRLLVADGHLGIGSAMADVFKKVANATVLIWRLLLVAECTFRHLDHPELLPEVLLGARYRDGIRIVDDAANTTDHEAVA